MKNMSGEIRLGSQHISIVQWTWT